MKNLYRGIYLCLGYPSLEQSLLLLRILQQHPKVDFIEIGLPFSDPVADGKVISAAAQAALCRARERNLGLWPMLEQAMELCQNGKNGAKDIYVMTYGNIIYLLQRQGGNTVFRELPLKGLIIPDVPLCEQGFFRNLGQKIIPFATPETTDGDLARLSEEPAHSAPFVYFVALRGITGSEADFRSPQLRSQYAAVRRATAVRCATAVCRATAEEKANRPVVIGFGVRSREHIRQLSEFANGFVIGTAAVERQADENGYRAFLDSL